MAQSISGQNFVASKPKRLVKGMDHIQNRPMDERSIVARENVSSLPNDQIFCDWCRRHCGQCIGPPVCNRRRPFYLNPEANVGAGEDGVTVLDWSHRRKAMAFLVKSAP